jgi:hypothetical protein
MTLFCRAGAVLGGPSVCRRPILSAADAEALGLKFGPWCDQHGRQLVNVRDARKSSEITTTIDGVKTAKQPQTRAERKAATEERRRLMAADVVDYVLRADRHPVKRKELAAALGIKENTLSRCYEFVDDERVVFVPGAWYGWYLADNAPTRSGYYAPNAVPDDLKGAG